MLGVAGVFGGFSFHFDQNFVYILFSTAQITAMKLVTRVVFIPIQAQPYQRFYSNEVCAKHTGANCWSNPKRVEEKRKHWFQYR
jgi:hypothetical protein